MKKNPRVLMVGSAEQSAGGVASVIRTMKRMPMWSKFRCGWLGTQIQSGYGVKLWYALKAYAKAACVLWRYDIIHFHTVPDRIGLLIQLPVFLMARMAGKKIVMQIHMGNQLAGHTRNKLFLWHLRRADLIILLAPKWERMFKTWFPSVHVPTTVVFNAVAPVPEVRPEEKRKLVLMAAYLNENKAPDVLLRAWRMVCERHAGWRVAILGNGDVERFRRMAGELGVSESVEFTGYMTGKAKEDYFRKAAVYCMCSHEEGFPMVVLEAWAYGACLVTTPVGGLPDVLEEGRNALTFDFDDAKGLAGRLEQLMDAPGERLRMGRYSREFVYGRFSMEKISDDWEKVYGRLAM